MAALKTAVENTDASGSVRLFSVRHEFSGVWARFQSQTPGAGQRVELRLAFRPEHYPFWSQGRLKSVESVVLLARSTQDSLDVFDRADKTDTTAQKDTLAKDPTVGNLLVGSLKNVPLPEKPVGEIKLFFDDAKAMTDLWIAVTWRGSE